MTPVNKRNFLSTLGAAALLALGATAAQAAEPLKIGMVLPMSGPFASYGKQIEAGARLYLAQTNATFSGRKVELIIKDDTGVAKTSCFGRVITDIVQKQFVFTKK